MFFHVLLFLVHFITYWIMSFIFFIYDVLYNRIKGRNYEYISIVVLLNQIFLSLPLVLFFDYYFPFERELCILHGIWQIPCLIILHDILFYHLHRLMHTRFFYKFHKTHHKIKNVIGVGALYAGSIEHIFVNMLPAYLPPFILQMNYFLILLWIIISTISTITIHSGYNYFDKRHEYHHENLKVNFGLGLYLCDRLYGTYKSI